MMIIFVTCMMITFFLKTKKLSYSNEATDFHNKENPEAGSVYN